MGLYTLLKPPNLSSQIISKFDSDSPETDHLCQNVQVEVKDAAASQPNSRKQTKISTDGPQDFKIVNHIDVSLSNLQHVQRPVTHDEIFALELGSKEFDVAEVHAQR